MILVALLVRSGALDPGQLLRSDRTMLANLNGITVLLTAFAASAQVVTLVVPESGVPALMAWLILLSLLLQAFAVDPDRVRLLRGLMVTFMAAFVLKFIVLAAISAPAEGRVTRALQLLFEGVTLGSITQRTSHGAEGYLAFAAIVLYLIALAALPSASWQMVRVNRRELTE
jgi:phage shock protein PspC (stress-responsive transcriptional regulator)